MVNGRMFYLASPEYMAEYARRYALLGVSLIGGCCGTTPEHIHAMKKFLKAIKPSSRLDVHVEEIRPKIDIPKKLPAERSPFGATLNNKFSVSVEVDPPVGVNPGKCIDAARELLEMGVDAVNIADGPRAMARMSPIALGILIKEKVGIEIIVHYCCRDRNLLGMQMDLIGAAALGLNNILPITGDPPKMGHYPDATAVFDIDSIGLIKFATNLNCGVDFAERPIKESTNFLIGCGVNPGAVDLELEVMRFRQKIEAGADFAFSQPIYDVKLLENFLSKSRSFLNIPLFVGILPLVSLRNAEFLHNEVSGMQIPSDIMKEMSSAKTHEKQLETGLAIAKEALTAAKQLSGIKGAYVFPPFGRYKLVGDLMKAIK
jgi:homocysteine S-methyltransferase